jgi:hypothetical protein
MRFERSQNVVRPVVASEIGRFDALLDDEWVGLVAHGHPDLGGRTALGCR